MQDMNTAFAGSIPKGWSLTAATAIDNNGDIVGYGNDGTPGTQGFLFSPALPGDANLDGRVDVNDLTVVLTNFGTSGTTWATGDFVGDGKVDVNDLTIVLANFGRTSGRLRVAMFPPCPSLPPWRRSLPSPSACSPALGDGRIENSHWSARLNVTGKKPMPKPYTRSARPPIPSRPP